MPDRRRLEEIYAVALDEWEFRLFGTRSHMAALGRRRWLAQVRVMQDSRLAAQVFCPHSLLIVSVS